MAAVVGPKSSTRTTRGSSTGRASSKIKTYESKNGSSRGANSSIVQSGKHIVGNYLLQKKLGVGTFGEVRLAIHIPTGEKVAVKILEKSRVKEQADIRRVNREIKILKKARHSNIIQLYEVLDTPTAIYLMMENAEGGEMFDYIVAHKRLAEREACCFFHQILEGVDALHRHDITHRDLKPENLLLKGALNGWVVKIVDFGLSNTHEGGKFLSTACGSPCYAAPEMIAGREYSGPLADIWSMGIILFALVCGYLPFEDPNTANLYKKILSGDYKAPRWISGDVRNLISRILETEPSKRYTLEDIRRHAWYAAVRDADVPREESTEAESMRCHDRTIAAMEEQGMDIKVVLDCVSSRACNSITATYYLLQQKHRTAGARAAKDGYQDRQSTFIGSDSAHLAVDREGERERGREMERDRYNRKKADCMVKKKPLEEDAGETEIEAEEEEAEETILITLPKNYYTVNGAALHTKIAMTKAREEQNAALINNESIECAAAGSGNVSASAGVVHNNSITTMSYDSSANNNSNSSAVSARKDEKSKKYSNVIPSYLSLRAKSAARSAAAAALIHPHPPTPAPPSIEHVMRRPDLQPPSFAARRGGRTPAASPRTDPASVSPTPKRRLPDDDKDKERDKTKERERDKDKENGSVRAGATAASPVRERNKERPKKEDKGKPGSPRAPIVVGVRSAYSVAGVIAAARQLASNSRKSPATKEVKEGYSTIGPFASPARATPTAHSTPITNSKQQAARPSERADKGSSSTGAGAGGKAGVAGRIAETLTVHVGSKLSILTDCEGRAAAANSEEMYTQPAHVLTSDDASRSESAESARPEAEGISRAQVDFIDLNALDAAGAKAALEGLRRPPESPRGYRQKSRGAKDKDREGLRDRREEAKEEIALDTTEVSFAMPFPLDLSIEGLRLSQERPSTRRGSPRSSGVHTGATSPVRPRPADSVRSGPVIGVAATSQMSQKSSNRAPTSDTAPMRRNPPSSSSTSHTSSNASRQSALVSAHTNVLGINTAVIDMNKTGYVSTTVSSHSNMGYDISIGEEERDCKEEQKSRNDRGLDGSTQDQRQGKGPLYESHHRNTQDNGSILLAQAKAARTSDIDKAKSVDDDDCAVVQSEGDGAIESCDGGQNDSNNTSSTDDDMGADTDRCSEPSTATESSKAQEKEPAESSGTKCEEGAARRRMSLSSEKATDDEKDCKGVDETNRERGASRDRADEAEEKEAISQREEVFVARPPPNKLSSGPSSPRPPGSSSENQFRQNRMRRVSAPTPPTALPP